MLQFITCVILWKQKKVLYILDSHAMDSDYNKVKLYGVGKVF